MFGRLIRSGRRSVEDMMADLEAARAEKEQADALLHDVLERGRTVVDPLVDHSEELRIKNHFGESIERAFRRKGIR